MNLSERYAALKKKIGGNREVTRYEYSFGQPKEERMGITPMTPMNKRILSQIEFAISLSKTLDGKYDDIIDDALSLLEKAVIDDGVLTNSVCSEAEKIILPLSKDAKEYKLILAGHAHIDMNWMWSWHETVAITLATFRTMLKIMDEYPEFCFSQSQASVYKIVEEFEPELMDKIKQRIKEGRWEITASAWVETDKNMPNTESLIRHIKYTKSYLRDTWGIDPDALELDFSPDTFGHSANLPEIDTEGGLKYYYHCRGLKGNHVLYRWIGPSGKELLCYREQDWYNSGITPKIGLAIFDISQRCAGFKTGLVVYGVGDHGGGPTRRDVESALEMMKWPVFPTIKFGTILEYFHEAESIRDKLPIVDREMNMQFPGCYTTQSRIKLANRKCEAAFADTEALCAVAAAKEVRSAKTKLLEENYKRVLFTHFHDIITGSCVRDSREYAMGQYSEALAHFNNEYLLSMSAIAENTDTSSISTTTDPRSQSEGAGVGFGVANFNGKPSPESGNGPVRIYTVFNPTPIERQENVELTIWDYTQDMRFIKLSDEKGNPVEFQLMNDEPEPYWDHKYFKMLAHVKLKPLGYTTLVLSPKGMDSYPVYIISAAVNTQPNKNVVLDNGIIRAEFDYTSAAMISIKDLATGKEYIKPGQKAGFVLIDTEATSSDAWHIGKYQGITPVTKIRKLTEKPGSLKSSMTFEADVLGSKITAEVSLEKGARSVTITTTVDWNEVGGASVPVLAYALPVAETTGKYLYDIPAGVVTRPAMEIDVPALSFAMALSGEQKSAAIVTDCKYGYRAREDGTLISTLINSAVSPDKYPERGMHNITLNVGIFESAPKKMQESATALCRKFTYVSNSSHKGSLPAVAGMLNLDAKDCIITSVAPSDGKNALVVRLCSLSDKEGEQIKLSFEQNIKRAFAVDYFERPADKKVELSGNTISAHIGKGEILTVKVEY